MEEARKVTELGQSERAFCRGRRRGQGRDKVGGYTCTGVKAGMYLQRGKPNSPTNNNPSKPHQFISFQNAHRSDRGGGGGRWGGAYGDGYLLAAEVQVLLTVDSHPLQSIPLATPTLHLEH